MTAFVYDTGALIAAENSDPRIWAIHTRALERRAVPIVPAGVLTEAWRGNNPSLARFLAGTQVEPLDAKAVLPAFGGRHAPTSTTPRSSAGHAALPRACRMTSRSR